MSSETWQEKNDRRIEREYKELQSRLDDSIRKEEARRKILQAKREEKRSIKKSGGGKQLAKEVLHNEHSKSASMNNNDTDFNFGNNLVPEHETIDQRIERENKTRCMERVVCSGCGTSHGFCAEITEDKEKLKMLPTGNEATGTRQRKGGMDWIKNEDLTTQPKEAKILMVRYNKEGRYGARVEMKLAMDGAIKYWGIPPKMDGNSPNYRLLTAKFGHDENNWVDQRITLQLEKEEFGEQYFVRVDFPKSDTNKRGR